MAGSEGRRRTDPCLVRRTVDYWDSRPSGWLVGCATRLLGHSWAVVPRPMSAFSGATFRWCWHILEGVDEQEAFLRSAHPSLVRAAYLLTGQDASAQDLVQETLVRVVLHWRKVSHADSPTAYAHRIMLNVFLGQRRRLWTREDPHSEPPEQEQDAGYAAVADRDLLTRALLTLPARQRAAVVLRHYQDLSEGQTAQAMGCSTGNVKALTSRGLAALRTRLEEGVTS